MEETLSNLPTIPTEYDEPVTIKKEYKNSKEKEIHFRDNMVPGFKEKIYTSETSNNTAIFNPDEIFHTLKIHQPKDVITGQTLFAPRQPNLREIHKQHRIHSGDSHSFMMQGEQQYNGEIFSDKTQSDTEKHKTHTQPTEKNKFTRKYPTKKHNSTLEIIREDIPSKPNTLRRGHIHILQPPRNRNVRKDQLHENSRNPNLKLFRPKKPRNNKINTLKNEFKGQPGIMPMIIKHLEAAKPSGKQKVIDQVTEDTEY